VRHKRSFLKVLVATIALETYRLVSMLDLAPSFTMTSTILFVDRP
jgi:hypothetical protein